MCTEWLAYVPFVYVIDPVGAFRSDFTLSVSTVVFGARVTSIVSFTDVPSQVYGADGNVPDVGAAAAPETAPALAGHAADVTPFRPSGVRSSVNDWFVAAGPSQSVEPLRNEPVGPAASSIGELAVICVTFGEENVEETPALFVTTIRYA